MSFSTVKCFLLSQQEVVCWLIQLFIILLHAFVTFFIFLDLVLVIVPLVIQPKQQGNISNFRVFMNLGF